MADDNCHNPTLCNKSSFGSRIVQLLWLQLNFWVITEFQNNDVSSIHRQILCHYWKADATLLYVLAQWKKYQHLRWEQCQTCTLGLPTFSLGSFIYKQKIKKILSEKISRNSFFILDVHCKNIYTVGSKIFRALEIIHVKKLISNAVFWNK